MANKRITLTLRLGLEASNLAMLGGLIYLIFLQACLRLGPDQMAELIVGAMWLVPLILFLDLAFGSMVFLPVFRLLKPLDTGQEMEPQNACELWRRLMGFPAKTLIVSIPFWTLGTVIAAWWMIKYGEVRPRDAALVFPCCLMLGITTTLGYFFRARILIRPTLDSLSKSLPEDFAPLRVFSIRKKLLVAFILTLISVATSFAVLSWMWREQGVRDAALKAARERIEDISEGIRQGGKDAVKLGPENYLAFRLHSFIVDHEGDPASADTGLKESELAFMREHRRLLGKSEWESRFTLKAFLSGFLENIIPLPEAARFKEPAPDQSNEEKPTLINPGNSPERWIILKREPMRGGLHPGVILELEADLFGAGRAGLISKYLLAFYMLILVLLIILYADWLAIDVGGPVKSLRGVMDRVSGDHEPEPSVVKTDDEVGELTVAFNSMAAVLGEKMIEVREMLEAVGTAVTSINQIVGSIVQIASDQAAGAVQQASSLHQISSTSEQIAATLRTIAENAQNVDEVAGRTLSASHEGQRQLGEVIGGMEGARAQTRRVGERMVAFQEQANKIEEILDFIRDISNKTNLIALNAAIEASAVGEAGSRFSIVASEMRKLAEQTMEGTEQIQKRMTELQEATSSAIMATEEGEKKVDKALGLTDKTSETFQNIVHWAGETARSAQEISLSSSQQTTATDHLATALIEIQGVAGKFADAAKSLEISVAELDSLGSELSWIVGRERNQDTNTLEGDNDQ